MNDSARAASDIPGLGSGALPRVMIIFDNSRSMILKPDDQFGDLTWEDDDYDPDNNPGASCQNKFCIAKKVLSGTLPAYSSLTQMGLATYYQYLRTDLIPSGGGTTDCTYDVLAAPGEVFTFATDNNNGPTYSCSPLACSDPPKTCTLQYQDPYYNLIQWFSPARGSSVGSSQFIDSGRTYTLQSITQEPPAAPYDWFEIPDPCPTPKTLNASYTETSNWGCSPTNPCTMFYKDQRIATSALTQVFYQNLGPSYTSGGVTYAQTNSTLEQYPVGSPPCQSTFTDTTGLAPGCSTATPCDFTYVRTDTSPVNQNWFSDQGASYVSGGTTFTKTGSTVQGPFEVQLTSANPTCQTAGYSETSNWTCSPSNPCAMTFTGIRVQSGEITTQYCQYNRTVYTYSGTQSSCIAQRTVYTYSAPGTQTTYCQYARQDYNFYAPAYIYQWNTVGGEWVDQLTIRGDDYSNWCPVGGYAAGFGPNKVCPPRADNYGDPCTVGSGRVCMLQWRSPLSLADGGTSYPQGRNSTYLGSDPSVPSGCLAPDRPDGGVINQPNPGLYVNDWCSGVGDALTTRTETRLQSDYYDPTAVNRADAGFPMNKKYSGWSRAEDGTNTPSQTFVDVAPNTLPQILQAFKKYYSISAPTPNTAGIRTAQNDDNNDFTPLYGSLTNAGNYLSALIAADPDYSCRPYYVLLITDGQEYTPKNYAATDLQNVVTSLRNLNAGGGRQKDVKTFVIGFGNKAVGGPLDLMARAGGTAVNPTTLRTDLVNGVALNAMSGAALKNQLDLVFSAVVAGAYSRSKPLLSLNGSRIYAGYFNLVPNSLEWQGNLDAFNVSSSGAISPVWRYAPQLDALSSRIIYTKVPSNASLIYFDTQASGANSPTDQSNIYTGMNTDPTTGDRAITFLRNISKAEAFTDGSIKSSRASDIYHSSPAIVGTSARSANWGGRTTAEQSAYQAYKTSSASREVEVYVGANDAMLHAIREDPATAPQLWAGSEKWAYVPPGALPKVLANRNGHTFSVDGNFGIDDVCSPPCASASDWKTVLVGSMREGGPSLYALDVSDPANPHYWWDYNDGNLGNTWSGPVIGRVTVNTSSGTQDKWVVFVGGGVHTTANRGNYFAVIDALSGTTIVDGANTVAKFKVDLGGTLPKNNLPSRPSLYRPQDGAFVKTVYFGDTQGRLNRMDVSGTSVASWTPVRFFDPADTACKADIFGNAAAPIKLPDGTQVGTLPLPSISSPPAMYDRAIVAQDPNGRRMVFAGTGDTTNPTSATDVNYFYAVRDSDTGTICSGIPAWVKQFAPGEKVISDAVVVGNAVIFSTYKPPPTSTGCNQAGSASIYAFDMVKGTPSAVLKDSLGNNVSRLDIPNAGITSDLQVSGGSLVFNTSNNPNQPRAVALNVGSNVQVRSWKKVR